MRLLLDTHTLIWWDGEPDVLPRRVFDAISDPLNDALLSVVSLWEMQVKVGVGKMELRAPLDQILSDQEVNGMSVLSIQPRHVFALGTLPLHHRDPFDRMLAAQAIAENATLVTRDGAFANYPVRTLW